MREKFKPGRPTLYDPKYCDDLIEYFSEPPYEYVKKKIITKKGDVIEIEERQATDFKSLAGFANKIGVSRDTLHEWAKVHSDFSDAYKKAKDYQEEYLATNGNHGLVAQPFSIFTAKNVLNWSDKRELNVTGKVESVSDEELDKRIKLLEEKAK